MCRTTRPGYRFLVIAVAIGVIAVFVTTRSFVLDEPCLITWSGSMLRASRMALPNGQHARQLQIVDQGQSLTRVKRIITASGDSSTADDDSSKIISEKVVWWAKWIVFFPMDPDTLDFNGRRFGYVEKKERD